MYPFQSHLFAELPTVIPQILCNTGHTIAEQQSSRYPADIEKGLYEGNSHCYYPENNNLSLYFLNTVDVT